MGKKVDSPGRDGITVKPVLSRWWYWLGVAFVGIGIVLTIVFVQVGQRVPAPVETFRTDESVEVTLDDEGLTILFGDGWDVGRSAKCGVADADGDDVSVTYGPASRSLSHEGDLWVPVYETSDVQPPGTYTVLCTASSAPITIGVAPRDTTAEWLDSHVNIPWLTGLAAGVIATVVVFVLRRRGRARMREMARKIA